MCEKPALEMKYGGSSPIAVPKPQRIDSIWTCGKMLESGTEWEPCGDENNGGPNSEQSFLIHDGLLLNCIVSYGALLISTLPHCIAFIVKKAMWGPKYRTKVCRPDPDHTQEDKKRIRKCKRT